MPPPRPASAAGGAVASAPDVSCSSPGATSSSAAAATSIGFSSAPMNPNSHIRRHKPEDNAIGSPSSSGSTQDEDIRFNQQLVQRPSSAESQVSVSSSAKAGEAEAMSDDDAPLARSRPNQNQPPLPSLSSGSAALLQLRDHQRNSNKNDASLLPAGNNNRTSNTSTTTGNVNNQGEMKLPPQSATGANQNQATSFRRNSSRPREEGNPLIPDEEMNEEDDMEEEERSAPTSPNDQREVRIMFHGREIFAEDLIGLRVAKTFAGHGRFLGQVVKFDKRVSLYTVVYADGDAEDLTIDGTLQILIQDEIERADPAQMPLAISLLLKKAETGSSPASPDTGDFMMPPPRQASAAPPRPRIQVSEREAQFVISLFENHALPSLVRQGWRVQPVSSGRVETRFVSPTGEIFPTALDVVGFIASDKDLLTVCFPANVHLPILSLLPHEAVTGTSAIAGTGSTQGSARSASKKRTTLDPPNADQFDGKRTRQVRDDAFGGVAVPTRGGVGRTALYRPDDLDRRAEAASRMAAYRGQGMGGRIRMSGDRFVGGETTSEARIQAPPEPRGYRRASSRDPTLESPFSSRWAGVEAVAGRSDATEYAHRFANSPGWRERSDAFVPERHFEGQARNRIRPQGRYIHRLSARNPADAIEVTAAAAASGTPPSYYRDASPGGQASPMTNGLAYPQFATMRARSGDFGRPTAAPRVARETASFMSPTDTLGASAAFSMVDVDRISKTRPGRAHMEQPRGRSPRQSEAQQSYLQHQSLQHHRRTNSGTSYHSQRGSESHYVTEAASGAQKEQRAAVTSAVTGAASQQPRE